MLDNWETDGGYPAHAQTPKPSLTWSKSLDYQARTQSQLASATISLGKLAGVLRPLSDETKELLRPLIYLHPNDRLRLGIFSDLSHFTCESVNLAGNTVAPAIGIDANPRRWNERIPASRIDERRRLIAPTTDFTVVILSAIWGDDRIIFEDIAAKQIFDMLSMQWKLYFLCAEMQANYKAEGVLSPLALSFPNPTGYEIADYQRCAAACAAIVPGYCLWMKPGTGKTLTTIVALDYLARRHKQQEINRAAIDPLYQVRPMRVYVTCPKDVRINWLEEFHKFSTCKYFAQMYSGPYMQRNKKLMDTIIAPSSIANPGYGYDWIALVGSYGMLRRDAEKLSITTKRRFDGQILIEPLWDLGILDEGHYIKNRKALQSRGALMFRDACARRIELTGTPMPNSASDLYPQLEFVGAKFSGFTSQKQFDKYFKETSILEIQTPDGQGFAIERSTGVRNTPLLKERIARICFTISKEDALKGLPPKVYSLLGVTMSAPQAAVYERALNSITVQAENELGSAGDGRNYQMVLQNVLKKLVRLTQITSGFFVTDAICDDDGNILNPKETHRFDPNPKLELLIEKCKELPSTSKGIIAACWQQDIRTIAARMQLEGLSHVLYYGKTSERDREINLTRFNTEREPQFLLGNPATFGVGRNILGQADDETNCDHIFIFSQGWSSSIREQLEDRNNRRGTRKTTYNVDLIVPGTVDQQIRDKVVDKRDQQMSIQNVRDVIATLRQGLAQLREVE